MLARYLGGLLLIGTAFAAGLSQEGSRPLHLLTSRVANESPPVVDLGYARYQGAYNLTFGTNVYRG
jgi:hypothetical protein